MYTSASSLLSSNIPQMDLVVTALSRYSLFAHSEMFLTWEPPTSQKNRNLGFVNI